MIFEMVKKIAAVQKEISLMELFLKGFPVRQSESANQSQVPSRALGTDGVWWQERLPILSYYYPLCKFFFLFNL